MIKNPIYTTQRDSPNFLGNDGSIKVKDGEIVHRQTKNMKKTIYPLASASAQVESIGDIERRVTATRELLMGPLALAKKKAVDHRQLFMHVGGPTFAFVVEVDPNKQAQAREFAAKLTTWGHSASGTSADQASASADVAAALAQLGALHADGVLTDHEFATKKAELLSRM